MSNLFPYTHTNSLSLFEQKVQVVEAGMLEMEQVDCPVVHRFGPNIYIREVTLPAGSFSIGHYQKTTHMNVMLTGKVTMVNEDGTHTELVAPQTFVSKPGRKIGYIHEKVIWQNIYATDETDVEKLEEMFLEKSITFLQHQESQKLLLTLNKTEDQDDYLEMLKEIGFTEELVREQTENLEDQIEMPYGNYSFMVSDSMIQGKGVFATKDFKENEIVGPARVNGLRTPLGRFTNHSKHPNAKMIADENGDIFLVMTKSVNGCKGGQKGDEIVVDYRQVLQISLGEVSCQE
jgi:hypothetical protein